MKKNYCMGILLLALGASGAFAPIWAQVELSDANLVITHFTQQGFEEGGNIYSSGTANRVKVTLRDVGDGSTSAFSPAQGVTCDGTLGSTVVQLSYRSSQPGNHSYIQVENLGTAAITHIAIRGWYNAASSNNMLTYGYSITTDQEEAFTVPPDSEGWEDTPLYFTGVCSIGSSFDETGKIQTPGARYIRISSEPTFPGLGFDCFYGYGTDVSLWGIYIWTDDDGIPSSIGQQQQNSLSFSYKAHYLAFSKEVHAELYDLSGKKLLSGKSTRQLSLEALPPGLYILKAKTDSGERIVSKIERR